MNLKFLGDALDHWKGAMFASLRGANALRNFAVDPMANDIGRWRDEDFSLFAGLLQIAPSQVIRHRARLEHRAAYFGEISHIGDLFLDPDTGVATGRVREGHVSPAEVGLLLDASADRLLVIYQHVRGMLVAHRVSGVMSTLEEVIGPFSGCSYESGTVAMLFLTRMHERTELVAEHFDALLGRHATRRIRRFEFRR